MRFEILRDAEKAKSYSPKAHMVWLMVPPIGLELDYKTRPKDGLIERLENLKSEGELFNYEFTQTELYAKVAFEVSPDSEHSPKDFAEIIDDYFE